MLTTIKSTTEEKISSATTMEDGRCELVIVNSIQALLDLTNPKEAEKRKAERKKEIIVTEH